ALPSALVHHDPWLALFVARHHRADGHWALAMHAYERAEAAFAAAPGATLCRSERSDLGAWLDLGATAGTGWSAELRKVLRRGEGPIDASAVTPSELEGL